MPSEGDINQRNDNQVKQFLIYCQVSIKKLLYLFDFFINEINCISGIQPSMISVTLVARGTLVYISALEN